MDVASVGIGNVVLTKGKCSAFSSVGALEGIVFIAVPVKNAVVVNSGKRRLEAGAGRHAAVGRAHEMVQLQMADAAAIGLSAPLASLAERAERLIGVPRSTGTLDSEMVERIDLSMPVVASLVRTMNSAMAELTNLDSIGMVPLALAGYEELLFNLMAAAIFPSIARTLGSPSPNCAPAVIRRARDYIKEYASEVIELSKLAKDLGVSMRAMHENFQRYYGFSPRDYILECRLERARELLLVVHDSSSVTFIALECGFGDLGHFSARYRDRFGELPSETLRFMRRQVM